MLLAEPTRGAFKACASWTGSSPAILSEDWSLDVAHLGRKNRDRTKLLVHLTLP